jgi:hypothetical protein
MNRGTIYRRKAVEIQAMAAAAETEALRDGFASIASQYEALAAHAERSEGGAVEPSGSGEPAARRDRGPVVIGLLSDELG